MFSSNTITVPTYDEMYGRIFRNGVACGFPALGESGFLRSGYVTYLFSRSWLYRSALAMQLAQNMLEDDSERNGVLVISPRFSREEYVASMAKIAAEINAWRLEYALIPKAERKVQSLRYKEAVEKLKQAPLFIEDSPGIEPDDIVKAVRDANREHALGLVIIDSLQGLGCGSLKNAPLGWSVVGSRLKQIAQTFEVPVLVLSGSASKEMLGDEMLRGYGCLDEYIDRMLLLSYDSHDAKNNQYSFLLRRYGAGENEHILEFKFGMGTFKISECLERHKDIDPRTVFA